MIRIGLVALSGDFVHGQQPAEDQVSECVRNFAPQLRDRGGNAKIDWKALSKRIGHADVAFTMKQHVQTDLDADRLDMSR